MRHTTRPDVRRPVTGFNVSAQTPLLEFRTFGENKPKWIVWLAYNTNRDAGTYLILHDDGSVWRETTYPDGSVSCAVITPPTYVKPRGHHEK